MQIHEALDPISYNNLPNVEEAEALVIEQKLVGEMARKVGHLFVRHMLNKFWGIALLHHHWDINDREIPAETSRYQGASREYVMTPRSKDQAAGSVPSLLEAVTRGFQALEFSFDPFVSVGYERLVQKRDFLTELHAALTSSGLHRYFALSARRELAMPNTCFVETTMSGRQSVTRETVCQDADPANLIETVWTFAEDGSKIITYCASKCSPSESESGRKSHSPYHEDQGQNG